MNQTCPNCGNHYKGKFCNNCGQKTGAERFSFGHIFSEVFHAFTHADKGFLTLFRQLLIEPGKVAYEYIVESKRKKYFNLFTFFILITAISAFAENKDIQLKEELFQTNNQYGLWLNIFSKSLSFVTIPVAACAIWLIHLPKRKLMLSEYTVFAMVLMSVKAITDTCANLLDFTFTFFSKKNIDLNESMPYGILLVLMAAFATYTFHRKLHNSSWWQSLLSGFFFLAVQVGVLLFVIWAVFNSFKKLGIFQMYGLTFSGN